MRSLEFMGTLAQVGIWTTDLLLEQDLWRMKNFGIIWEYYVDYKTSLVTMSSFPGRLFQANAF